MTIARDLALIPPLLVMARSWAVMVAIMSGAFAVMTYVLWRGAHDEAWIMRRADSGWWLQRHFTRMDRDEWVADRVRSLNAQYKWIVIPLFATQTVVYLTGAILVGVFGLWT